MEHPRCTWRKTRRSAAQHAGDDNESCSILTAEITSKPEALTADADPQFSFSSASGVTPALGFECELQSSDAKNVDALHSWQKCKSPAKYEDLADGTYTFAVRVKGEELAEAWRFDVDISPPVTTLLQVRPFKVAFPPKADP